MSTTFSVADLGWARPRICGRKAGSGRAARGQLARWPEWVRDAVVLFGVLERHARDAVGSCCTYRCRFGAAKPRLRALVGDERLASHPGVHVWPGDVATGYRQWAGSYDEPRNGLFDIDEPAIHEFLDSLPLGRALDAACGTGRYSAYLAGRGHAVVGVDSSVDMLAVARARLPNSGFIAGSLDNLPVPDSTVDLVVCALALAHMPDLGVVMAEFARVLRSGGHLVISDVHHELIFRGSVVRALTATGEPGLVATYRHTPGDFLRAALPAGLQVRRCEEPLGSRAHDELAPSRTALADVPLGTWQDWPWSLLPVIPVAVSAAWAAPSVIVWDFELHSA